MTHIFTVKQYLYKDKYTFKDKKKKSWNFKTKPFFLLGRILRKTTQKLILNLDHNAADVTFWLRQNLSRAEDGLFKHDLRFTISQIIYVDYGRRVSWIMLTHTEKAHV